MLQLITFFFFFFFFFLVVCRSHRLQIGSEEVTVPLVLSRVFHQILPALEPVLLSQSGETCGSATLFRLATPPYVS